MTGISTTNIPPAGGGVPKLIQPSNVSAKILSIYLDRPSFLTNGEYNLVLMLETASLGDDFEGFFIDKDDPSKGRHKGQIGRVKAQEFAFSTGTTKTGIAKDRDKDIVRFLYNLFNAMGMAKWYADQDHKYNTIEELVKGIDKDKPFKDIYLNWCIAGKEYDGKNGYKNYDLYLPFFGKDGAPVEREDVEPGNSKLYTFDKAKHLKVKKAAKPVNNFSGDPESGPKGGSDFDIEGD